jgi:uncharacterized membrane protein YkgB
MFLNINFFIISVKKFLPFPGKTINPLVAIRIWNSKNLAIFFENSSNWKKMAKIVYLRLKEMRTEFI